MRPNEIHDLESSVGPQARAGAHGKAPTVSSARCGLGGGRAALVVGTAGVGSAGEQAVPRAAESGGRQEPGAFHRHEHGRGLCKCRAKRGALCTFRSHPAPVLLALSTVIGTDSTPSVFSRFRIRPSSTFLSTEWSRSDPDLGRTKWG
jgi:hypothetical protein